MFAVFSALLLCKADASLFTLLHTFQISLAVQVDEGIVIRAYFQHSICPASALVVAASSFDRKLLLVDHVLIDKIPDFSWQLEKQEVTLGLRS